MQIEHFEDISSYYQTVKDYLLQQEAIHCLMLAIGTRNLASQSYLSVVKENDRVLATAIRNPPPDEVVLSKSLSEKAIAIIARNLANREESLPGVIAPQPEALIFARQWQSLTGKSFKLDVSLCIYQLEAVKIVKKTDGYLRLALSSDRHLIRDWIEAFEKEALGEIRSEQEYQDWCDRRLRQNSLYIWQTDIPVSMAGFSGATPNGIRINAVYTPPEYRRKGYASSCVAALSQKLLEQGYKYCFLFTDLAYPTSNRIYQAIGYESVCDINTYEFEN